MAHHHSHGGHATAAKRRGESYCSCATCGHISGRYQAERPETFGDFVKAMVVALLLVAAMYVAVLVMAAYQMGSR